MTATGRRVASRARRFHVGSRAASAIRTRTSIWSVSVSRPRTTMRSPASTPRRTSTIVVTQAERRRRAARRAGREHEDDAPAASVRHRAARHDGHVLAPLADQRDLDEHAGPQVLLARSRPRPRRAARACADRPSARDAEPCRRTVCRPRRGNARGLRAPRARAAMSSPIKSTSAINGSSGAICATSWPTVTSWPFASSCPSRRARASGSRRRSA